MTTTFASASDLQGHYAAVRERFYPPVPGYGHGVYRAKLLLPPSPTSPPAVLVLSCEDEESVMTLYWRLCDIGRVPNVRFVAAMVAYAFGLRVEDLARKGRTKQLVRVRHIAMFLCRAITGKSYPIIGRAFGDRDHTTIIHACQKFAALIPRLRPEHGQAF